MPMLLLRILFKIFLKRYPEQEGEKQKQKQRATNPKR